MPLTLLQIVQAAQGELGLPQSTTVVGNTDATTLQMYSLSNRVLDELRRMNRWTAQQFEYNLVVDAPVVTTGNVTQNSPIITGLADTTDVVANYWAVSGDGIPQAARVLSVDSATQITMDMECSGDTTTGADITFAKDTYPMPSDFDWYNNRTMWDRTNRWELLGPDSPQLDQWHRSGIVATGPRRHFRQLGPLANRFRIWPPPVEISEPLQLVFEYLSIAAVAVNGSLSTFAQYFLNDDDQPILDDQSVVMGIKWMFWQAKGFNYAAMQNQWVDYVKRNIARDGAAPTLQLVNRVNPIFLSPANVPRWLLSGTGWSKYGRLIMADGLAGMFGGSVPWWASTPAAQPSFPNQVTDPVSSASALLWGNSNSQTPLDKNSPFLPKAQAQAAQNYQDASPLPPSVNGQPTQFDKRQYLPAPPPDPSTQAGGLGDSTNLKSMLAALRNQDA